jgi:hypothetical protein
MQGTKSATTQLIKGRTARRPPRIDRANTETVHGGHGRVDPNPILSAPSIPKISFVDDNAVLFQDSPEFILEAHRLVVFFLIVDVVD